MPLQTVRSARGPSGYTTVKYRDTNGKMWPAIVLGPGTGSGLKLRLTNWSVGSPAQRIKDDVPKATNFTSTNAYFLSHGPGTTY